MQDRIEPPILLSRLLTLVFAATVVVSVVLAITLYQMFPLDRPEVFFLRTANPTNTEITMTQVLPEGADLERFKRAFIAEYIKTRNEITPSTYVMKKNWDMQTGAIKTMSSDDVFANFYNTAMYQRFLLNSGKTNDTGLGLSCSVEFPRGSVSPYRDDGATYLVAFRWFCTNNYGQTDRKEYRMKVKVSTDNTQKIRWADRMENPLGLKITEYSVETGDGDPLDAFVVK